MTTKKRTLTALFLLFALFASACSGLNLGGNNNNDSITASGTISADIVAVAPEIGGKVIEVLVEEGDRVAAGDVLLRVDDEILQAQYDQAQTAVEAAAATVESARAQADSAQVQYEMALQGARLQDIERRATAWLNAPPDEIDLPAWYYDKNEQIKALETEVDAAQDNLDMQLSNLEKELQDASNEDFVAAEVRLAAAQTRFENAVVTLEQAQAAADNKDLENVAQEDHDSAQADLETAQLEYNRMLSTSAADNVLEARALVAIAQARLDNARDALIALQSGEDSLQVEAAQTAVDGAQKAVEQAEANLAQAEAALQVIALQLDKTAVTAPISGVALSLNIKTGELVSPGQTVMTIGQLETVDLIVYIPEDRYGGIQLGQQVSISVDSVPSASFEGQVQHIADQAEFTPRNVQTVDGRKTTVYAVKIRVPNGDDTLKPGMPADVTFAQ